MATSLPFKAKSLAAAFTQSNQAFTLSLLRELPSENNVFYSPFIIANALAMVHLGAKSDTLKEMTQALHFDKMGADVHSVFGSYLDSLANKTGDCTLQMQIKFIKACTLTPKNHFSKIV
jgi:serine protease inhibitor